MAQDIGGTELATTWHASSRVVRPRLEVQWDGTNWVDETAYLTALRVFASLVDATIALPSLGTGSRYQATVTLRNAAHRFTPDNSAGPLYAHIQNGFRRVPVRISAGILNSADAFEYVRIFTGYIDRPDSTQRGGEDYEQSIRLYCLDHSDDMLQAPVSTILYQDQRPDELIEILLGECGMASYSLDRAATVIPWGWFDEEDAFRQAQQIAAIDGGAFFFDQLGVAQFHSVERWLTAADSLTPQATIAAASWFELGQSWGWDNAYTGATATYTPRSIFPTRTVYESHKTIALEPGETDVLDCVLDAPCETIYSPMAGHDYEAVSSGFADLSGDLDIIETRFGQRLRLELTNNHASQTCYIIGLQVRGIPVEGEEAYEEALYAEPAVLTDYWRGADQESKLFYAPRHPLLQTAFQARRLAGRMRDLLQYPRRILRVRAQACPYLELSDRVTVTGDGGLDLEGIVLGQTVTWGTGQMLEGEYLVLPVAHLYLYDSYFQVGTHDYESPSERVFW